MDYKQGEEGTRKRFLPFDYARCLDADCPRAKDCARYLSPWREQMQSVIPSCRDESGATPEFIDVVI